MGEKKRMQRRVYVPPEIQVIRFASGMEWEDDGEMVRWPESVPEAPDEYAAPTT